MVNRISFVITLTMIYLATVFVKNIERLERICESLTACNGYAILLTNSPRLWMSPKSDRVANDAAFLLHEEKF